MAKNSQQPQVNIPEFQKPTPTSFNTPWGSASYSNNAWNYNMSPEEQQTSSTAQRIRQDLLNSLGISKSGSADDPYTKGLMSEGLRMAQPQLENALIGRGLGGSPVYKDALTDLISKVSMQALLGGQNQRLSELSYLQNLIQPQMNYGQNLMNMGTNQYNQDVSSAQNLYNTTLPFKATYNGGQSTDYSGLGSLLGTGLGALLALPTGGMSVLAGGMLGNALGTGAGQLSKVFM